MFVFGALTIGAWTACTGDAEVTASPDLCETYCKEIRNKCTGGSLQYRTDDECLKACALLPTGTSNDVGQNTVGCRLRVARAASTLEQCVVAGPFGGNECGTRCLSFCAMVSAHCGDLPTPPYSSEATCIEECRFPFDPAEGEGPNQNPAGNDTINCRSHHLILALSDKTTHCPHTAPVSPVCLTRDAGTDAN